MGIPKETPTVVNYHSANRQQLTAATVVLGFNFFFHHSTSFSSFNIFFHQSTSFSIIQPLFSSFIQPIFSTFFMYKNPPNLHHFLTFSSPYSHFSSFFYKMLVFHHSHERGLFENLKISRGFFELVSSQDLVFRVYGLWVFFLCFNPRGS